MRTQGRSRFEDVEERPRSTPIRIVSRTVLFTSGSTGVPKGVAVTASERRYLRACREVACWLIFRREPPVMVSEALDGWQFGMVSTLGADLGNTSLFPSLFSGGHVCTSCRAT